MTERILITAFFRRDADHNDTRRTGTIPRILAEERGGERSPYSRNLPLLLHLSVDGIAVDRDQPV